MRRRCTDNGPARGVQNARRAPYRFRVPWGGAGWLTDAGEPGFDDAG